VPDLCALTLTATGGTTYTWSASPANGLVVTPPPGPTATVNLRPDAGIVTYTVKGEGAAACPHTESITLNVGNIPVPAITQTTACAETAIMNATPVGTFNYRWYVNGSGTPDPTLGGSAIPLTLANDGTSYEVEIFEPVSGCTRKSIPFVAHVFGVVDASLASTPPCNDDQPITLTAATVAIGATFSWTRDGTPIAGVTTPITQQTAEGRYQVIVTKGTCSATAELQISRAALPEGELPNIAIICDDPENNDPETASVDLDPGSFISYDWLKNGITLSYTNRVFTADSKGTYEVKITDAARCSNIDKTEVLNECVPVINGPNAFKPGSTVFNPDRKDLTNSDFWVFTRFIDEDQFKVFIFNRWGEMVYSSTDRFFKWNGGYNNDANRPAPPGTYSYVVQYVSAFRPSEGVKEKRGGVALIR